MSSAPPPTPQFTEADCNQFFADGYNVSQIAVDPPVPSDITTGNLLWAYWAAQLQARQAAIEAQIFMLLKALGG